MKSALSFVAILLAVVLLTDGRSYTRMISGEGSNLLKESISLINDGKEASQRLEVAKQEKEVANKAMEAANQATGAVNQVMEQASKAVEMANQEKADVTNKWKSMKGNILDQFTQLQPILEKTKTDLHAIVSSQDDATTKQESIKVLLTPDECQLLNDVFGSDGTLAQYVTTCSGTTTKYNMFTCIYDISYEGLTDGQFKEAKSHLLERIIDCEKKAFQHTLEALNKAYDGTDIVDTISCNIGMAGDLMEQVKREMMLGFGLIYLETTDSYSNMITAAFNNVNMNVIQQTAWMCSYETSEISKKEINFGARNYQRQYHVKNIFAGKRQRHNIY